MVVRMVIAHGASAGRRPLWPWQRRCLGRHPGSEAIERTRVQPLGRVAVLRRPGSLLLLCAHILCIVGVALLLRLGRCLALLAEEVDLLRDALKIGRFTEGVIDKTWSSDSH